jgi:hypothetical protein
MTTVLPDSTDTLPADGVDFFEEQVWIPARTGRLEGRLIYDPSAVQQDIVMLLSPHPNFAGTMDNNLILALSRHLGAHRFAVLRFNYPGVGASSLEALVSSFDYWDAVEKEQRFEAAVLPSLEAFGFLKNAMGASPGQIHLVGYSFGGIIAAIMAEKIPEIQSVTAVSMPWISRYAYGFLENLKLPKVFISGDKDFAFEQAVFDRVWPGVPEPKTFHREENDHFFRNAEAHLAQMVIKILEDIKLDNMGKG